MRENGHLATEDSVPIGPDYVVGDTRYTFHVHRLLDGRYGIDLSSQSAEERGWWGNWAVVSDRTALTPEWLRARLSAMIQAR